MRFAASNAKSRRLRVRRLVEPPSSLCNPRIETPDGCRSRTSSNLWSSVSVTRLGIGHFIWHDIILFGKLFTNILFLLYFYMAINNLTGQEPGIPQHMHTHRPKVAVVGLEAKRAPPRTRPPLQSLRCSRAPSSFPVRRKPVTRSNWVFDTSPARFVIKPPGRSAGAIRRRIRNGRCGE